MQGKHRWLTCVTILLAIAGCAGFTATERDGGAARLDGSKAVLVAVPEQDDAADDAAPARLVAKQTARAFSRYARRVDLGPVGAATSSELIDVARRDGAGYLVLPSITQREPAGAPLRSEPASMTMGVVVIDVASGEELTSINLEGRSRIARPTSPQHEFLVPRLVVDYVDSLY